MQASPARPRLETEVSGNQNAEFNLQNANVPYNTAFNVLRNSFITKRNSGSNNTLRRSFNVLQKGYRHPLISTYAKERTGRTETPYNFLTRRTNLWQGKRHSNFTFPRKRSENQVNANAGLAAQLPGAGPRGGTRRRRSRK